MNRIYATRIPIAGLTFLLAVFFCFEGLASNGALLGKEPTANSYATAILYSSSYFVGPLLVSVSCIPFIAGLKFPVGSFILVAFGALAHSAVGNTFLALLTYPLNIFAVCLFATRCFVSSDRTLLAVPILLVSAISVPAITIGYVEFTEREAEGRARAFCSESSSGKAVKEVLDRAKSESKNLRHLRYAMPMTSRTDGDGEITMLFRGVNLYSSHECRIKVSEGKVVSNAYAHG